MSIVKELFWKKIQDQLAKLTTKQKVLLATATGVTVFSLIMLLVWANRAEYALLYSKLDAAETAKVIEDLKANSIPYRLQDDGSTVFVRKEDVYELRIKYAGENIISNGTVGYELFDKNNLGLTDFMQRVNLKRALEGELSNTINEIEAIDQSRVHLVLPEQRLFEEQQKKATASVILRIKPHTQLDEKQISGITNLVAASVEGLEPEAVTIVDTHGRMLTKKEHDDEMIGASSSQYELRKNVENYLGKKAQSMLDEVLGDNNAIVRVSAELSFDKVSRTSEQVDPDNVAVLSEERNEESTANTDTTYFKRENTITNYELNKTVEQYQSSIGDIKKLSVAVFVNGVFQSDEEPNVPRSDEEIQKITDIVKNAVGFSADRNDEIEVQQLAFDRTILERENRILADMQSRERIMGYVKTVSAIVGAILLLFGLRTVMKKLGIDDYLKQQREMLLQEAQASLEELTEQIEISEEERQRKLAEEAKARQEYQEKVTREVVKFSADHNERASRILRYWLVDDEE